MQARQAVAWPVGFMRLIKVGFGASEAMVQEDGRRVLRRGITVPEGHLDVKNIMGAVTAARAELSPSEQQDAAGRRLSSVLVQEERQESAARL